MKKSYLGREWWCRGKGPHATYGLSVKGEDMSAPVRSCPVFIEAYRVRGPSGRLASKGWAVRVGDVSFVVYERGTRGRVTAMQRGLDTLAAMG